MIAATAICAAGTSQAQTASPVINNQIQLGDVFATQTLDVVSVQEGVGLETTATGNSAAGSVVGTDMSVISNQTMAASARATTTVNATGSLGAASQINTTATGNAASVYAEQGTVTGVLTQIATYSPDVTARGYVEAPTGRAGDLGVATTAVSNSAGINLVNGSAGVRVNQSSAADVLADGGATVQYVSGTANVSGVAAGNSVALVGTNTSAARIATSQVNTSNLVQASQFTAYGNAQTARTSAQASGNIVGAVNDGPLLDVASNQYNQAYVRAQAEGSAYQFGEGVVDANAVGNSVLAGDNGEAVVLDNVQVNTGGGVEAIASFTGHEGYDAYSRATAIANDVTAYSCSACVGSMNVNNRQTNDADVGADARTTITGSARSVNSTATAIGNNANFFVSRPGS
ncbi:holdfast anchor protein HfaD [Caulobacter mirabilis]|nr:holdfast anchor protein HfaD [Caulobacter mirabilis]